MKLRFLYILLTILGLSLNTDCLFSDDHEINVEMIKESFNKNDDEIKECEEKSVSRITQIIDTVVDWNQKYIIPLSYAYICYDYSKHLYKNIKDIGHISIPSERIYPNYSGDNPLYQKLVSKVAEVGQKVGKIPRSIIITKNLPDYAAATVRDIIVSEDFFENKSENEVEYIIAHELSHIKKYHAIIRGITYALLSKGYLLQSDHVFDTSYEYSNAKKIFRMIYTSPLLYHFCAKLIWYAVSRYCEKDADLTAAAAVGVEGGMEWCKVLGVKTGFFDTHPRGQERFEYFQAFKNSMQ